MQGGVLMESNQSELFGDKPDFLGMFEHMLLVLILMFLFSVPFMIVHNIKSSQEMLKSFESGSVLWCKAGYDLDTHIKVSKSDGWRYVAKYEMFVNDTKGISVEYNKDRCSIYE